MRANLGKRACRHGSEAQDRITIVSRGTTVFVNPRLLIDYRARPGPPGQTNRASPSRSMG